MWPKGFGRGEGSRLSVIGYGLYQNGHQVQGMDLMAIGEKEVFENTPFL